jgi:hypothetical protein
MSDQRERAEGPYLSQPLTTSHTLSRLRPSPAQGEGGKAKARKASRPEEAGATADGMPGAKRSEGPGVTAAVAEALVGGRPTTSGESRQRVVKIKLDEAYSVFVRSGEGRIILQLRRLVHDSEDPVTPSFKSAVELEREQALKLAGELLLAVVHQQGQESAG